MIVNVLEYLEAAERRSPDKKAIADENRSLTWREYAQAARRVGSFLIERTGRVRRPVAVLIDRNVESPVAFLGCAYSGNFYAPIDTALPAERIAAMLAALDPVLVLNASAKELSGVESIPVQTAMEAPENAPALRTVRDNALDIDPLYTIFTSGSTGVPKGVLVSHRSVIDLVEQFGLAFDFDGDLVFGNQAPFDFDVSVKDLYNALRLGATVEILPKKYFMMPLKLVEYLNARGVNILIWAVSALRIVAEFHTLEKLPLNSLRYVMFSGECMPIKVLNYWRAHLPAARFVNLYGPTEITCNCTYYEITRDFAPEEQLPIGRAFRNTQVLLLDDAGQRITRPGEKGELCVAGSCLALGYWNDPAKSAEKFVQDPAVSQYGRTLYRTGDMAYYNEEQQLVFASRRDFQIKHMGHRIELGEIELAVNALDFIDACCCQYDTAHGKIVLFYQAGENCVPAIVAGLGKKLPKYMWPNCFERRDRLPLNKNSKIDRQALMKEYLNANP